MEWFEAVEAITPHVVRISTPGGSGTGFLLSRSAEGTLAAVATAAHVVDHAHFWEQPIRLHHVATGESVLLRPSNRAILVDHSRDTAAIIFEPDQLPLPLEPIGLIDEGQNLKTGVEIGWLGFPSMAPTTLSFFSGNVSAWWSGEDAYLVDGVMINGVSGGPAFTLYGGVSLEIIGVASAYMPNRATGETLPGVGVVRDVVQLQDVIKQLRSMKEAQEREVTAEEPPVAAPVSIESEPTGSLRRAT